MCRGPPELTLGLGVRRAPDVGHHDHARLARKQPSHEARYAHRLLGAQGLRQRRQPLGDRCGLIVDHVVHTAAAVLDCRDCGLSGIGDVDEGPHAAAVSDKRELVPADELLCFSHQIHDWANTLRVDSDLVHSGKC